MALRLNDPDDSLRFIIEIINQEINYNTKCKSKSVNRYKDIKQVWMSKALLKSLKRKNKMKYKLNKNKENQDLRRKYNAYRNTLNNLIKYSKKKYYEDLIKKNQNDSKKTWNIINEIIDKRQKKKNITGPKSLWDEKQQKEINRDWEKANYANMYFTRFEDEPFDEEAIKVTLKKGKTYLFPLSGF